MHHCLNARIWACILALVSAATTTTSAVEEYTNATADSAPRVAEHELFSDRIPFRNPFDRAIQITQTDSTCTCETLAPSSYFLLPYQSAELSFAVTNHNRSGLQQQRVWLEVSDPGLPRIPFVVRWTVTPNVTADILPAAGPFDQRPANTAFHNIYGYTSHVRPDEPQRLRKLVLISSPQESIPDGGLRITGIDYQGSIWTFTTRINDNGSILFIATASEREGPLPIGEFEEPVVVHTNHPLKPRLDMMFYTAIDPHAGGASASDPWGNMR